MPTFAEAAAKVIALNRATWTSDKTVYKWEASFSKYANPWLGQLLVDNVTAADVLKALTPIWTSKNETARGVRRRIGVVMDWAVAQGYRLDNPAGAALKRVLPKMPTLTAHQLALPYAEVAQALRKVHASGADMATKLSLEFLALTATRSGETRMATWDTVGTPEGLPCRASFKHAPIRVDA